MRKKKKICNILSITMVFALLIGITTYASSTDEDNTAPLTREEVITLAIENSDVVEDLESSLVDLIEAYDNVKDMTEGLAQLHDIYPRYERLYNKNERSHDGGVMQTYLELSLQIASTYPTVDDVAGRIAEIEAVTEWADDPELLAEHTTLTAFLNSEAVLTPEQIDSIITVEEYYELQTYKGMFSAINVTSPMSNQEEYLIFIRPAEVVPNEMYLSIQQLKLSIELAKASVGVGAGELYDTILMMENINQLVIQNYEIVVENQAFMAKKYELGQASEADFNKATNNMVIAELEADKMARDIENVRNTLKQMLKMKQDEGLVLSSELPTLEDTLDEAIYISNALENRSEILMAKNELNTKEEEFELLSDYYSRASEDYKMLESELSKLEIDIESTKASIEVEIRKAYLDILSKKEGLSIKENSLAVAQRQVDEMEVRYRLGYITENTLRSINMLLIQSKNDYLTAYREYVKAVNNLEAATSIGPGY